MPKRRHRGMERRIALERIEILFRHAEHEALQARPVRARRYVDLARRIGMRYNVRVPAAFKRRFCKECLAYLLPGVNARVRVGRGRIVVTCTACGAIQRMPFREERRTARARRRASQ
ncbi:MAG TPA: ribonuclease P protein component 4 [Thermoplasmata archaeon]|nr:ribonuclease P protein component 4 [Thermoplasmata archaeon]